MYNIADVPAGTLQQHDYLIIGCPTWDIGQLQADWDKAYNELDTLDLSGKQVAIFGLGDQYGYKDNESDKSPQRVTDWVWQLVDEFDLVHYLEPDSA